MSADALLSNRTMQEARIVEFPKAEGAAGAKKDTQLTHSQEFISKLLRFNPHDRPEILTILQDKYFSVKMT